MLKLMNKKIITEFFFFIFCKNLSFLRQENRTVVGSMKLTRYLLDHIRTVAWSEGGGGGGGCTESLPLTGPM